ncbi:MAG: sulfotransferase family protein, partial [Bacteroidales bacterium]
EEARPAIEKYLSKKKGYKKNQYKYDDRTVELVNKNWAFALDRWGYDLNK